jgi:hypothetical protein
MANVLCLYLRSPKVGKAESFQRQDPVRANMTQDLSEPVKRHPTKLGKW